MRLAVAVAWLAAGLYAIFSGLRQHRYVASLPNTAGNRQVRFQHYAFTVFGFVGVGIGFWHLIRYFGY